MYYNYFNLERPPFRITPDTDLFFPGGNRGVVLDALVYAIKSGEGIVKVVGEVGSGKTMLCRMLEKELPENVEIVYLANPSLSPQEILHAIAFDLQLKVGPNEDRLLVMHILHSFLLKKHAENRRVVMFIEEAQSMPVATLEEIRLLSNLETKHEKLLQIVLFSQPELDQLLARPEIRQLRERITHHFYLHPFKTKDIRDYLNSRLHATGYRGAELFGQAAIKAMERYSQGLLRRINILADKALLAAYASNALTVTAKHVKLAAKDSGFVSDKQRNWLAMGLLAGSLALGGFTGVLVYYQHAGKSIAEQNKAVTADKPVIPNKSSPVLAPTLSAGSSATVPNTTSQQGATSTLPSPPKFPIVNPASEQAKTQTPSPR